MFLSSQHRKYWFMVEFSWKMQLIFRGNAICVFKFNTKYRVGWSMSHEMA